jgi:hypothetical protein
LTGSGNLVLNSGSDQTVSLNSNAISNVRFESPRETGLVGYWKLDGDQGQVARDATGTGHDGTLLNGARPFAAPAFAGGFENPAGVFLDGVNDQITVPDAADLRITGDITISFWMWRYANTLDYARMVGKGGSVPRNYGVWTGPGIGYRVLFQQYNSAGAAILNFQSTTAIAGVTWYHVACTVSGTTGRIYINGVQEGSATRTGTPGTSTEALTFGYAGIHSRFPGALDDVRIYNRALSATEIAALAAGRYSGGGGGATFTLGADLTVNGTLAVDNGTLATGTRSLTAAATDSTKTAYVNAGVLNLGSGTATFNGGLIVQPQGTITGSTSAIILGAGKALGYYDTSGTIEGFPTSSFDWNSFAFWRTYVAFRAAGGTTDRVYARSVDGGAGYSWDLPSGQGNLLGTPRWTTEGSNHYLYLATTDGWVYKLFDNGATLSAVSGWPYRNGASATATSPLLLDANNVYWCGNDGAGARKLFNLTHGMVLNSTWPLSGDVVAAPTASTLSGTPYLFVGTGGRVYRTPTDLSAELTSTQPTTTVNGRLVVSGGTVYLPEDNGTVWALSANTLGTTWSYQDADAARHPGGCGASSQCTVKNIYVDAATGRIHFGDRDGHVYAVGGDGAAISGYPWRPGTSADQFQTAPLSREGVTVIGAANGNVYVIDQNAGAGPALITSTTLPAAVSTISFNPSAAGGVGRYTIATSDGKLFYLGVLMDPTPGSV